MNRTFRAARFALFAVIAVVALQAQHKRTNGDLLLGSPARPTDTGAVRVQGNLMVEQPIFPAGGATNIFIDGGLAVSGNVNVGKIPTLRVDVLDAGQIFAQGTGPITRILPWTSTIDFTTGTITCTESSGITVTGARTNDACMIGPPTSGGSTNAAYTCYVSGADTVKARHCPAGTADDPVSATFSGVVISTAQ